MSTIVKGIVGVAEVAVGAITGQGWLIGMGVATLLATAASLIDPTRPPGLQTLIAYDPSFPRQLIVGRTITGGSIVAQFTHDNLPLGGGNQGQNRVLEIVVALADHECDGLEQIIVDGQVVGVNTEDPVLGYPISWSIDPFTHNPSVQYTNHLWVKFFSGADGQTVDTHLNSVLGDTVWPTTSVGTNVCYARITAVYDPQVLPSIPSIQFVLRGAKLYDPRQDSTVGGSGSQVWGTPSTYTWTENAAVIAYNLCRGIYVGGNLFYGAGASADEVPFAQAVAAMNVCDETVSLKAGGTEPRYVCGGQMAVNQDAQSFLQSIATAMGGYIGTGGGSIVIFPGVAQTPVTSFTDDDIMAKEQYDNAPKFGFDTLKNAVFATYLEPANNWTTNSAPARTSSTDITTDGGIELSDTYSLDIVHSNTQAQRVMEIIRQRNRRMITQTVTLGPNAASIERGDWVQWTSSQWGYSAQSFFVAGVQLKPNLDTVLNLVQVDSDIYDWTPSTDELPATGGLLPSAAPPAALSPTGITVAAPLEVGADGTSVPRINITFDDPNDATVVGALAEAQIVGGSGDSVVGVAQDASDGVVTISGNLLPATEYQVRVILQAIPGRATAWSSWFTVTTPAATLPTATQALIDNSQAALRTLTQIENDNAAAILNLAVALNGQAVALGSTVAYTNQQLTKQITEGLEAEAQARTDLAAIVIGITTGNTETALAARLTTDEATIASLETGKANASDLATLNSQINTPSTGLAAQVSLLNTTVATLDPSSSAAQIQQTAAAARAQGLQLDAMGETLLNILSAMQNNAVRIAATLAFYTSTITATVVQGQSAQAQALADLSAMMQTADTNLSATINTNNNASVTRDQALTDSLTNLTSYFGAGISPTSTVAANIASEASTRAAADAALTATTNTLSAALTGYTGSSAVANAFSSTTAAINSKSSVFVASSAPTAIAIGDLWVNTGSGNTIETWTGTSWVPRSDLNKVTTFAQTSAPTANAVGDIWINTTAGANTMSRWSGSAWVAMDNATIATTASSLASLTTTVNGHTSSISTITSDISGIYGQWGVQVNTDGAVTSYVHLDGSAASSNFVVAATNFYYYDPTAGATPVFSISGSVAYFNVPLVDNLIIGANIIANSITTAHLQVGSATTTATGYGATSTTGSTTVCSPTITGAGNSCLNPIDIEVLWSGTAAGSSATFDLTITCNVTYANLSTNVLTFTDTIAVPASSTVNKVTLAMVPPTGSVGVSSVTAHITLNPHNSGTSASAAAYLTQILK